MKALLYFFLISIYFVLCNDIFAQRTINGIFYNSEGRVVDSVMVSAHKTTETVFTNSDGKYEIKVHEKAKWIKFRFKDEVWKLELDTSNVVNIGIRRFPPICYFNKKEVNLWDAHKLLRKNERDFLIWLTYMDDYKLKRYSKTYNYWKNIVKYYPKCSENIYIHGIKILEDTISKTQGDVKKKFINELMGIYDQRIKYFNNRALYLGDKGMKLLSIDNERTYEAYNFIKEAVNLGKEKSLEALLLNFMKASFLNFNTGKSTSEIVTEDYNIIINLLNQKAAATKTNAEKENINNVRTAIERMFLSDGHQD